MLHLLRFWWSTKHQRPPWTSSHALIRVGLQPACIYSQFESRHTELSKCKTTRVTQEIQSLCTSRNFKVSRFLSSLLIKTHILIRPCETDLDMRRYRQCYLPHMITVREGAQVPTRQSFRQSGRSTGSIAIMASVPLEQCWLATVHLLLNR